jgi:hypothetical protein
MCKVNSKKTLTELTDTNRIELDRLKKELEMSRKEADESTEDESKEKLDKLASQIQVNLRESQKKLTQYENQLKMNKNCFLDPVHFSLSKDLFGRLYFKDVEFQTDEEILQTKKFVHQEISNQLLCLELIEENGRVAIGTGDCHIKIFNLNTCECVIELTGHADIVFCLQSVSKSLLMSGSWDHTIKVCYFV